MAVDLTGLELSELKIMVVKVCLEDLFTKPFFSICTLNKIMDMTGSRKAGEAYELLDNLHCKDYSAMPEKLRDSIPRLVGQCIKQSSGVDCAVNTALSYHR